MAQINLVAPKIQVHTNDVWHMQPPKLMEGDPATKVQYWESFKKDWCLFEKSGSLGRKSNVQKMAVYLLQAGAEARTHIRNIDQQSTLKSVEEVQRELDKLFLHNFDESQQQVESSDVCHNSACHETEGGLCKSYSSMENTDEPESTGKDPETLLKIQQQDNSPVEPIQ